MFQLMKAAQGAPYKIRTVPSCESNPVQHFQVPLPERHLAKPNIKAKPSANMLPEKQDCPTGFGLLTKQRMSESEKGSDLPHPPFVNKTKQLYYMLIMIPQAKTP